MPARRLRRWLTMILLMLAFPALGDPAPVPSPASPPGDGAASAVPLPDRSAVSTAIANVMTLERPGQDGVATVFDGNKYVQCRRMSDRSLRCEAAGTLMQPSMARILVPAKLARLGELGWTLDPSFGNHVRAFPPDAKPDSVADAVLTVLRDAYDADLSQTEVRTDWIASEPCPPRNAARQNLAGMIDEDPAMTGYTIHACSYVPTPGAATQPLARSAQDLVDTYGARAAGEIGRLRVNVARRVHIVFDTDVGYVQCAPDPVNLAIYCEAVSADSWPVMAAVLTPERLARLHAAGFTDPGRSPNYERLYPLASNDDASIARQILTVLFDVYGYDGKTKLKFETE